jgi:hypothetical protein
MEKLTTSAISETLLSLKANASAGRLPPKFRAVSKIILYTRCYDSLAHPSCVRYGHYRWQRRCRLIPDSLFFSCTE